MENSRSNESIRGFNGMSMMTKGFIVFALTLIMLIPIPFILNLIDERQESQTKVIEEIGDKWGGKQVVYGPFIKISYIEKSKNSDGKVIETNEELFVSANANTIQADVKHSIKKRSLYEVVIYNSKMQIKSSFPSFEEMLQTTGIAREDIKEVKYIFSVQDMQGIENQLVMKTNGKSYPLMWDKDVSFSSTDQVLPANAVQPETSAKTINLNFFSKTIDPSLIDFNKMEMNVELKGSQNLYFLSSGITSDVNLTSDWKDLKFDGTVLPHDSGIIKANLAEVKWKVYNQNPMNGQYWKNKVQFNDYTFGTEFIQMNDHYDKTYRSTKYAILFIGLTFVVFFFMDNRNKFNIHIIHYALVGFAILINFVLLLSISEYVGFNLAYLISAAATLLLITYFVQGFIKNWNITLKLSMMLILLYSFIYSVLQLKEHALLVGSIGLFIILAIIMYYSRNMEWNERK